MLFSYEDEDLADFQICINVPLTVTNWFEYKKKLSRNIHALMVRVSFRVVNPPFKKTISFKRKILEKNRLNIEKLQLRAKFQTTMMSCSRII